jgi:hypothetical protein
MFSSKKGNEAKVAAGRLESAAQTLNLSDAIAAQVQAGKSREWMCLLFCAQ